jgi:PAS domain-containing protein
MQAQHAGKKLSELQWTILSEIAEAVIVTDQEQHVVYWNGPAERLFGLTAEQTLGWPLKVCCPGKCAVRDCGRLPKRPLNWSPELLAAAKSGAAKLSA